MENLFIGFMHILESFVYGIGQAWDWLTTPWFTWGEGASAVVISPLMIFSLSGLLVLLAILLIKLLNPLN